MRNDSAAKDLLTMQKPVAHNDNSVGDVVSHYLDRFMERQPNALDLKDLHAVVVAEVEKVLIVKILNMTSGNQTKAAQMLGLNRNTLRKKIAQFNLSGK